MILLETMDSIQSVHVNIVHPGSKFFVRVKSGKFVHQVHLDTNLQTV